MQIARAMVESGGALAVMGNHEFNAIVWATSGPDSPDEYLRPHSKKNRYQHKEFLRRVVEGSAQHCDVIDWGQA